MNFEKLFKEVKENLPKSLEGCDEAYAIDMNANPGWMQKGETVHFIEKYSQLSGKLDDLEYFVIKDRDPFTGNYKLVIGYRKEAV